MSDAFRTAVAAVCRRLPGAELSDPWGGGHDAWKVGDRMFACIGAVIEGVAVKCDSVETAEMLKDAGVARHAPYFHRSWALLPEQTEDAELSHRIVTSYNLVRAKLPATVRRGLPDRAAEA